MSTVRDVIAQAIWRRVTDDSQHGIAWDDLWRVDREEWEEDADAAIAALATAGFVVIQPTDPEVIRRAARAIYYSHGGQRTVRSRQIVRDVLAALGEPEDKEGGS